MSNLLPDERRAADNALRLLREIAPTASILYAELIRYQDGDRSAAGRAWELLYALSDQLSNLRDVMHQLGGPEDEGNR